MKNALTVDLEEYFHPSEVQPFTNESEWGTLPSRVEYETQALLDLLAAKGTEVSFFVLGWVAERHPALIRRIVEAGHEVGCHSYAHQLVYRLTPAEFREDTVRAQSVIADATGVLPTLYRAPSYSITADSLWALEILVQCGFTRDSSIYPIAHDRYGIPGAKRHAHIWQTASGPITEIPIATAQLSNGSIVPIGGGGYLRLLPYNYISAGIRRVNTVEDQPACIYLHPWEMDPDQPRLATGRIARLRTYVGLSSMYRKVERLITDFQFGTVASVYGAFCPARSVVALERSTLQVRTMTA